MQRRAVFLDRDGVINSYVYHPEFGTVDSPSRPADFNLIPGAGEAIARLNSLGLLVVVVSNQPGIAKRKFTVAQLDAITRRMRGLVRRCGGAIDHVSYCLHHPESLLPIYRKECGCRKPQPGLLLAAAKKFQINLPESYMVGDGITDIVAGHGVGATTLFCSPMKCYVCEELARRHAQPDFLVRDLAQAAEVIESLESGNLATAEKFSYSARCAAGGLS